jgi:hypothetical protein
MENRGRKI